MKELRPLNIESPRLNNEDEFRSLFELSAVGAAQVSPEGRYVRVNQKFCQMLGFSEQELLQRAVLDVTHPDDREASAVVLTSSFNVEEPEEHSIEKRYVRKDGGVVWALVKWRVLRDENGKPIHTVANAEDITARRQAEDALRAREAQLRAIIDNSCAFIFLKDLEGRYLKVNRWYELMRGMIEAEMKGKTDYDLFPKDIADRVHQNDKEVIAAKKRIQFEEEVPFSDGLHHFVSIKFPLSGEDGKPYAVCGALSIPSLSITSKRQWKINPNRMHGIV